MWFFSVFCFCHVMAWMVDCFSFYKLTPPKVTHSPGLDFWLFSMFSHLASPSLPPFFCIISRILVFYPPLGWSVVRQVPQLSRSPLETCQHCPPFSGEVHWVDMPVSKSEHCLYVEQVTLALCVGLFVVFFCLFGSEIEQSKIFVGLGLDLDLLLVGWRWFMANNLSNFILFYISGCLYGIGLNVMSTVLHVIWIEGWGMAVPVTRPPSFVLYRKWLANKRSYLPWYGAEKVKKDLMESLSGNEW